MCHGVSRQGQLEATAILTRHTPIETAAPTFSGASRMETQEAFAVRMLQPDARQHTDQDWPSRTATGGVGEVLVADVRSADISIWHSSMRFSKGGGYSARVATRLVDLLIRLAGLDLGPSARSSNMQAPRCGRFVLTNEPDATTLGRRAFRPSHPPWCLSRLKTRSSCLPNCRSTRVCTEPNVSQGVGQARCAHRAAS
jgi:hypothetical protein